MKKFSFLSVAILGLLHATPSLAAKTCKDFPTQAAAQKYYEARKAAGETGWKSLDRDGDGKACDCNAGGNGKHCPKHRK
jgi:excalibur calcium-binding domain